jgi:hypothetical protein
MSKVTLTLPTPLSRTHGKIALEITTEITVYRFSSQKLLQYLRIKVSRIATLSAFESSKTLIRGLAKQGLFEDGKEDLLYRTLISP